MENSSAAVAVFPFLLDLSFGFLTVVDLSSYVLIDLLWVHIHVLIDGRGRSQCEVPPDDVLDAPVVAPRVCLQGL